MLNKKERILLLMARIMLKSVDIKNQVFRIQKQQRNKYCRIHYLKLYF